MSDSLPGGTRSGIAGLWFYGAGWLAPVGFFVSGGKCLGRVFRNEGAYPEMDPVGIMGLLCRTQFLYFYES